MKMSDFLKLTYRGVDAVSVIILRGIKKNQQPDSKMHMKKQRT